MTLKLLIRTTFLLVGAAFAAPGCFAQGEYLSGMKWQEPPIIKPGKTNADPPSDAIVLFDGKDLSAWEHGDKWIVKDGVAIVKGTDISTKQKFGDCQLHIEWSAPVPAKGTSQGRGNSGVFFMDRYELQVLDSYDNKTYFDGQASAIYKQTPPMANAMRPPGEWNTYDVAWTAPRFKDDGELESPAYITVFHNGVLTLNHFALQGITPFNENPRYEKHGKGPIRLQNHGNPVRYRNIWVREIKPPVGERERAPYFHNHETNKDTPVEQGSSVKGSVHLNGKPLPAGKIAMHTIKGKDVFSADIKDGKYDVTHLPPGTYIVTIETEKDGILSSSLPKKYGSEEQSGLKAEIGHGENTVELDLESK
jgi:3-keto-disaccharide hydrolase